MTVDLYLNIDHDIELDETGNLRLLTDPLEVLAQRIEVTLRMQRGEYFLNLEWGVPYVERILRKRPDLKLINATFRAILTRFEGVTKIKTLAYSWDRLTRALTVSGEIEADEQVVTFGPLTV